MKSKIKIYLQFLIISLISAFIFEEIPRIVQDLVSFSDVRHIWYIGPDGFFVFFLLWYGIIFSISYFIFIERQIKYPVIFGLILGMLAETILFKKMNPISFFLFPILYGLMFYFPFKINRIINYKEKIKLKQLYYIFFLIVFVIVVLLIFS